MDPKKHQFTVVAKSTFLPDESDQESERYFFAYTITITNSGTVAAQLLLILFPSDRDCDWLTDD